MLVNKDQLVPKVNQARMEMMENKVRQDYKVSLVLQE